MIAKQDRRSIERPSDTFLLDLFTVTARDIADADVNSLLALSVSVGWSHRAQDWDFMREVGSGWVALDESGRVHGSAMWFPFGDRFATVGMVITTPRLQARGGAQWLMSHVLQQAQGRALGLHATQQSHRLFLSLGFKDEATIYQHEGHVGAPPALTSAPDAEIRAFEHSDVSAVMALDRAATGVDRGTLIDALVARSRGSVLVRNGRLEACALMRPFGRGTMIGPVIANNEEDALGLIHPLMVDRVGHFVRLDVWEEASRIAVFAEQCGLPVCQTGTRMSLNKPWPPVANVRPSMFVPASQATG